MRILGEITRKSSTLFEKTFNFIGKMRNSEILAPRNRNKQRKTIRRMGEFFSIRKRR